MSITDGEDDSLRLELNGVPAPFISRAATNIHGAVEMSEERHHGPEMHSNPSWDTRISIAVDPVALITTECITVTSAMRKHARWAHSSVSAILGGNPSVPSGRDSSKIPRASDRSSAAGHRQSGRIANGALGEDDTLASRWGLRGKKGKSMQDNPLLSAFARLRNDLRGCTGRAPISSIIRLKVDVFQRSEALTFLPYYIHFSK